MKNNFNIKSFLNIVTQLYIIVIILVFPLLVDSTGFFKILECKYRYFLNISITYLAIIFLTILYCIIMKKNTILKDIKFERVQIFALIFLGINIIACIFSPFNKDYNLIIGVGRGEGLLIISLYVLSFIAITLFGKFNKNHILYFSIASILINLVCILQYIGFNPFNMYQDGIGTHNVSFMGTIGNVDFISAVFCILITISFTAFILLDENIKFKIVHALSVFMGAVIFQAINIRITVVAFGVMLLFAFPYIVTNSKRLYRFLILIATILLSYLLNVIINPQYHYDVAKIRFHFQFNYITMIFILIIIALLILAYILKNKVEYNFLENKKVIIAIYICYIVLFAGGIGVLYFKTFNIGTLNEIHNMLHGKFEDEYGTFRVFLWKRAITLVKDYPLFGTGPDTFAVRFMSKYTNDVIKIGELSINDTASNVYLTMLVNIGIFGLLSYLIFITYQIKIGMKNKNKYSIILLMGIICYLIQDFFNLWVVIVTPIFWVLLALHYISLKCNVK